MPAPHTEPYWASDEAFSAAVQTSTVNAAKIVARSNRRRTLLYGFLAGMAASAAIALPVAILLPKSAASRNCRFITEIAQIGTEHVKHERPEIEAFEAQSKDRFGLTQAQFDHLVAQSKAESAHRQKVTEQIARASCG